MNKKQRLVLAIFVPIIILFITLMIANSVGITRGSIPARFKFDPDKVFSLPSHTHNPFNLEKTWYIWMFYLIFCCIFEYKLFGNIK